MGIGTHCIRTSDTPKDLLFITSVKNIVIYGPSTQLTHRLHRYNLELIKNNTRLAVFFLIWRTNSRTIPSPCFIPLKSHAI
jgi:hypothetical protein